PFPRVAAGAALVAGVAAVSRLLFWSAEAASSGFVAPDAVELTPFKPSGGAGGRSSFVIVRTGFSCFFCSRARRAASATDGAVSLCDCARALQQTPVRHTPNAVMAINRP